MMREQISHLGNQLWEQLQTWAGPADKYGNFAKRGGFLFRREVILHNWNSEEGQARLLRAKYKNAFYQLAHCYQAQINPFYCGVACTATVLNALQLGKNKIPVQSRFSFNNKKGMKAEYRLHTQLTLLHEGTERIKRKVEIAPTIAESGVDGNAPIDPGLELDQVKSLLEYYGAQVQSRPAIMMPDVGVKGLRQDLKRILNDEHTLIVANFHGASVGAATNGHFSTLAAYDEHSDSV
ncbi:MAG: phytochelatin synthase family protein, partial [Rickettsiales bacterium]